MSTASHTIRFGVLGSGQVGQTLARGLKQHGYEVKIGSRSPAKLADFGKKEGIATGTFAEVAAWGEVLVLAVLGRAAEEALTLAGPATLTGKTIIDTTNSLDDESPEGGVLKSFVPANQSLMELLQQANPKAHFVKAFSCVGASLMVNPKLPGGRPTMFICGNDARAKATVTRVLDQFEWDVEDMGGAIAARAIEPLAVLWCIPGFLRNDWVHAFKVLRP